MSDYPKAEAAWAKYLAKNVNDRDDRSAALVTFMGFYGIELREPTNASAAEACWQALEDKLAAAAKEAKAEKAAAPAKKKAAKKK